MYSILLSSLVRMPDISVSLFAMSLTSSAFLFVGFAFGVIGIGSSSGMCLSHALHQLLLPTHLPLSSSRVARVMFFRRSVSVRSVFHPTDSRYSLHFFAYLTSVVISNLVLELELGVYGFSPSRFSGVDFTIFWIWFYWDLK